MKNKLGIISLTISLVTSVVLYLWDVITFNYFTPFVDGTRAIYFPQMELVRALITIILCVFAIVLAIKALFKTTESKTYPITAIIISLITLFLNLRFHGFI